MAEPFTRYECPVDDCGWSLDAGGLETTGELMPGATFGQAIEATVREVAMMWARVVDDGLREHMDRHTSEEYLRTIVRLTTELEGARRG